MYITLLNDKFEDLAVLERFESFLWMERFNEFGDFEFYAGMSTELLKAFQQASYIAFSESNSVMFLETMLINTRFDEVDSLTVKGRSLESILLRRVVWEQTILTGNLQNGIERLLNENVIKPKLASRRVPNFVFKKSTDPAITKLTIDAQYTGTNLYSAISQLCIDNDIGFRVVLNSSFQFEFSLYSGVDRSHSQDTTPYVIFSPEYDNLRSSEYLEDIQNHKNVALIGGEGEGKERVMVSIGGDSGLDRRELFVDARDLSSNPETGELTPEEYKKQLRTRGETKMTEYKKLKEFSGLADTNRMYIYKEDFFMGDVVQIENEYGMTGPSRVTELLISIDKGEGFRCVPTFTSK